MIDKGSEIRRLRELEENLERDKAEKERLRMKLESASPRDEEAIRRVEKELEATIAELTKVVLAIAQISQQQDEQLR